MFKKLPRIFRNFYVVTGLIFLVWMFFLDENDFMTRHRLNAKLESLEDEKAFYEQKIEEVKKDRDELIGNPELLEKYAREKYLMKKPSEDLFILSKE